MERLPLLKSLREAQSLSQRALAERSGVAHDTIGQLERGERSARPSTVRKLGAALDVEPHLLTLELAEAVRFLELVEEGRVSHPTGRPFRLSGLLAYLSQTGHLVEVEEAVAEEDLTQAGLPEANQEAAQEQTISPNLALDSISSESLRDIVHDIEQASRRLVLFDHLHPSKDSRFAVGVGAAQLLARSSARLLQLVAEQLAADRHDRASLEVPEHWMNISERQQKVLITVLESGEVGPSTVAERLEISVSTAYRDLSVLEEHGLVSSTESGKRVITALGRDVALAIANKGVERRYYSTDEATTEFFS